MFKLAERRAVDRGVYCGEDGLYLGPAPLIERDDNGIYRVRPAAEIEALLAAAYEAPPDPVRCVAGLRRVAAHLRDRNLSLAMIAAVQLGLGDMPENRIERVSRTDRLLKANFNPAEPRDAHGRWTNDGGDTGTIVPVRSDGHSPTAADSRAWESQPNADFRNRLAVAEQTADKPNFGYDEVHNSADPRRIALGRYQMTPLALRAAGMMNRNGNWTGKYGIYSQAQFLADPEAQEQALSDYLADNERQLQANGALARLGETIDGLKATFTISLAGLMAAAIATDPTRPRAI
jgi:hypothetical protein